MCPGVTGMPTGRAEAGQAASPRGRNVENEPAACRDTASATGQNLRHERRRQVHEQVQTENGVELQTLFRKFLRASHSNRLGRVLFASQFSHLVCGLLLENKKIHESPGATSQAKDAAARRWSQPHLQQLFFLSVDVTPV